MHLICNCQSGTVEESAETWMFATSGSAGPRRADKLSKIFFLRSRSRRCSGNSLEHCGGEEYSWSVDLHLLRIHLWGLNLFPRGKEGGCGGLTIGSVSHPRLVAIHFALVAVVTGVQACNFLGGCVGKGLCHVFVIKKEKMRFITRELFVHEY